ncbi:chemotaxis protein CheA [Rhodalgimonas zhirmunskyi]|uniref:Chemotaxis protein CheA n=1 Tax=Rhodalgimonas zhirmunskyi TaxID=2964767 RepID=A0AAJ1UD11_9RHOB|nr:chemotaxis protein CheA [Rhodoalgimonas zhirmunskyi]MDQ2095713.1 chemotaxis protein CheA [Rhodoalgimonas zhirmunskyi]
MDDLRNGFFQECDELFEGLVEGLNALDEGRGSRETINAMFRAVHSIKGGAGAFKLDQLVSFAHAFETALDDIRLGKVAADAPVVALLFTASDHLSDLVEAARRGRDRGREADPDRASAVLRALKALSGGEGDASGDPTTAQSAVVAEFEAIKLDLGLDDPAVFAGAGHPAGAGGDGADRTGRFRIQFRAYRDLFETGNDPALLFRALGELGALSVRVDDSAVAPLGQFDWCEPVLNWTLDLVAKPGVAEDRLREVFEFVEEVCSFEIKRIPAAQSLSGQAETADLCAMLPGHSVGDAGGRTPPVAEPDLGDGAVSGNERAVCETTCGATTCGETVGQASAPADEGQIIGAVSAPPVSECAPLDGKGHTIRVDLQRVDRLINLVGELVISESMLSQSMGALPVSSTAEIDIAMGQLKQLSGMLQESVMAIRAQPVRGLFQRMSRILRESARQAGKSARLVTQGEATEVDKTVTERLVEPLTHMIRNAVDHGLEDADTRRARGKTERGTITLTAAHRSGRVVITLSDDGGGIDRDKVRAMAVEKGLIAPLETLSRSESDNLLFLSGFSTAGEVSNLSGRGVGMDVVRAEIQSLGGRVTLASVAGEGTTVTISLPLTLAVMEGMIVQTAGETIVVPATVLRETVLASEAVVHEVMNGDSVLQMRDGLVPIVDLGRALGYSAETGPLAAQSLLLIEDDAGNRTALAVDRMIDQREVVIKGLEQNFGQVPGIAAATILGDGRIALIVDIEQLLALPGSIAPPEVLQNAEARGARHV